MKEISPITTGLSALNKQRDAVLRRKVFHIAWPVILEMSGAMLAGLITTAMVGKLGAVALAAVGFSTLLQLTTAMIVAAFGTGASVIISRESGAGRWDGVKKTAGQALMSGFLFGIALAVTGIAAAPYVFHWAGAEPEVAVLAGELAGILFYFTPLYLLLAIGNAILRGMAKTQAAFYIGTFFNAMSVAFSYALIFGTGVPAMGPVGAAWGSAWGQLAGGMTAMLVLARDRHVRLRFNDLLNWQAEVVREIIKISVPAAMEQISMQGGRLAFSFLLAGAGAIQFAGHQIAIQVESISFLPGFGFAVAVMTLVGQSLGRELPGRARRYVRVTRQFALLSMSGMGVLFLIFATPLTALFIDDPQVIYYGSLCVIVAAFEQPTIAMTYIFSGALRGAGDTRTPMLVTTLAIWVFRMPLVYLFLHVWNFGVITAWILSAGDFALRALFLWWRYRKANWNVAIGNMQH